MPHNNLARLYLSQGKTAEAIEKLETTIEKHADNTAAHMTLAFLYERNGQPEKAMAIYEKALALQTLTAGRLPTTLPF